MCNAIDKSVLDQQATMLGINPKYAPSAVRSVQVSKYSVSWHRDALKFHALSACILVTLIICVSLSSANGGVFQITQLYVGQCRRAKVMNQCMQLVCAITAIGMSVSFDFFIRLVSSPTVDDLRKAHSQGRSLDIGVHSFRNLRQLSHWRKLWWVSLVAISIPIQLFFHSSTFIVYTSTAYSVLIASEAFTAGADFVYPGVAFPDLTAYNSTAEVQSHFYDILPGFRTASMNWTRLDVQNCLRTYFIDPMGLQSHRNLLLVVQTGPDADAKGWKGAQVWNNTPPAYTNDTIHEYQPEAVNALWSFSPICTTTRSGSSENAVWTYCKGEFVSGGYDLPEFDTSSEISKAWHTSWHSYGDEFYGPSDGAFESDKIYPEYQTVAVKYCLSEPYSAPCKIFVSGPFLLISLVCVLLGSILSVLVSSFHWRKESCQCLGDALKVFMIHGPDITRMCGTNPMVWKDAKKRWGQVVSRRVWLWTYIPIGLFLVGGTVFFSVFASRSLQ